jgi:hypothetical protein
MHKSKNISEISSLIVIGEDQRQLAEVVRPCWCHHYLFKTLGHIEIFDNHSPSMVHHR